MTRRRLDFTRRAGRRVARRSGGQTGGQLPAAVDFALLLVFLLLAQGSAAMGEGRADTAAPEFEPVPSAALAARESLRLSADPAQGRYIHFSQADSALGAMGQPFALQRAAELPAAPPPAPVIPVAPEHATTLQFDTPYVAGRDEAVAAVLDADGAGRPARLLDQAQFLIAHMMLAEARGIVAPLLADTAINPVIRDRAQGYAAILSRLSGGAPATLPPAWRDDPLWPVLVEGRPVPERRLRAALSALARQSRAVATAALPILFDIALSGGADGVAAEILAAAPGGTDLEGSSRLDLMRGRLALAQGGEDLAFDTFARLAGNGGAEAVEARLLLADMALSRKDPALLPELSRLLQEGLPLWRGDATALRLRVRLARVAEDLGDLPLAVEVMAMIAREHPATPEAALAAERLPVMIRHLAEEVSDAARPLAGALATVRQLDPALSGRGDWVAVRAALAGRLDAAGLSVAAGAEYAAIGRMPHAALQAAEGAVLDRVALRHAGLLVAAGADAAAVAVLDRHAYPRAAGDGAAHAALRLRAGRTAVLPDILLGALGVADAAELPAPDVQAALASVAVLTGEADAVLAATGKGLSHAPAALRLQAARIAAEGGDAAAAARLADPADDARGDATRALFDSLAAPPRSTGRLSVSEAGGLITAAQSAGAAVDALLAPRPMP